MYKFENFAKSDHAIDLQERHQLVEKYLAKLSENLKSEAELLREDGFLVSDDCRIDPDQLTDHHPKYTKEFINQVKNNFAPLAAKFKRTGEVNQKVKEGQNIGELLEIVKTLLFNQDLFGGRLKVVRTSRVDDITNGVDEIAFDTETGFPIGVIDATASIGSKDDRLDIKMKIGGKLDFGVTLKKEIGKTTIIHEPLSELPLYVFEMRLNDILEIARAKSVNDYKEVLETIPHIAKSTLSQFVKQGLKILASKDISEKMRVQYSQANQIFIDISKEKGYRR